jgi:RHS repeat-associated protein
MKMRLLPKSLEPAPPKGGDDVVVTHTKSSLLQYNEYYPYGFQTAGSWTRELNSNSYLYNQGSESNTNTGWYETMFRDYDPVLGRFMQVDPLAAKYDNWSPYHYAFNDPVFWNDPSGAGGDVKQRPKSAGADIDAFANAMYGIYSPNWYYMTYGSYDGAGGSAFARYGPGDRGSLVRLLNYVSTGTQAGRQGWVTINFSEYSNLENIRGATWVFDVEGQAPAYDPNPDGGPVDRREENSFLILFKNGPSTVSFS